MKTTLLLFAFYLVLFQVMAQNNSWEISNLEYHPKTNVSAENKMLQRRLLLNEDQFKKVEVINTERNELLEKVAAMYESDPENYAKKALELELQYDAEFERILTKQQYDEYLAMQGRDKKEETGKLPEENQLAEKTEENTSPASLSFNDKIHAILEKATSPIIDSSLIARQDTLEFEQLSLEEESIMNGLLPQNAALIAIRADSAAKKMALIAQTQPKTKIQNSASSVSPADSILKIITETESSTEPIAGTEVKAAPESKPDGECKTCFDVKTDEEIALENRRKAKNKSANQTPANSSITDTLKTNIVKSNSESVTDSLFSETPAEHYVEKEIAIVPVPQTVETAPVNDLDNEKPEQENKPQNENSLALPAGEVMKLKQSLDPVNPNGTEKEEKTTEPQTPALSEPLPLHKSLAEEIEP